MTEESPNLYGYLTLLKNNIPVHKYKLAPKAWTIGGGLSNNIRFLTVDNRLLSTQCVIMVQDNGLAILKNKKAVIPIMLNKKKLNAAKVLEPGDIFEISTKRFLYENDVLTKKKIKELSHSIKPGSVLKLPLAPDRLGNLKNIPGKSESPRLSNKNMEFKTEEVSPDKLVPTKKSQLISTSFSKTPMPDKSCNKPSTRLSASTGKIYKFRKPTTTTTNKNVKVSSHIPVFNKKPLSSNATSSRIRTKIKLEGVFDNTGRTRSINKKRSITEISSTDSTPAKCTSKVIKTITTPSTPQHATRKRSSSQNFATPIDNLVNDSSLQLNSSSVSNKKTRERRSIQQNSVKKLTKTPESSFEVSYVLDTPIPSGTQKKLSESFVFTPTNKTSRRSLRKCTTEVKNRSRRSEKANKSIGCTINDKSMQLESFPDTILFSKSKLDENLAGNDKECVVNKDEVNSDSKPRKLSKRHSNNQINENYIEISDDSVDATYELNNSSKNMSRESMKPQTCDDEDILSESFGKELNSNKTENRKSNRNASQYPDQENFEYDENEFDNFKEDSFEHDTNNYSNANISSSFEQNSSKTSRRVSNYNKENLKPEENLENKNRVSTRRSKRQTIEELNKSNSFNDHDHENLKTRDREVLDSSNHFELQKNISLNESASNISQKSGRRSLRRSSDYSSNQSPFELQKNISLNESASNISQKSGRHSLRRSGDYSSNQSPFELQKNISLNESASNISQKSGRRSLRRSSDYSSNQSPFELQKNISLNESASNISQKSGRRSLRRSGDYSSNQSPFELQKNISLNESASNISQKSGRRSLRSSDYSSNQSPFELQKNISLNESASNISQKSGRRSLRRSSDYSSNQSHGDKSKLNIPEESRVSSLIKFSPITPDIGHKSKTSKTPASKTPNTSIKISRNIKKDESTNTDKESTLAIETTTEELHSSEEVYRTPDSVAKIPKQIPKTPKSNVKSRKSVFLQEFGPDEMNTDDLVGSETNNDITIVENNIPQTPKTPKSNRKVRIADNIPVGQPSIVKDLRKSIASPECNLRNRSSVNKSFQHSSNISSKSIASINDSLMQESKKTPYSRTKRSSSLIQLSPNSNRKVSIRSSLANVSTPKSNIKIRHSVTFEITADDLQSLAQSSPRHTKGVIDMNEVSKRKERSLIAYTEVGGAKQILSKKRQRSSIQICLPEKRQKTDDDYLSIEDKYNQQTLQDTSDDSSFEDFERKTPTSIKSKTSASQKRGFTDPKKSTEKYKRRSLPSEILYNQENKSPDYTNDNDYSFISSTDTSSILFEYHPATNANNLLENNITLKPSGLDLSGVSTLTPRQQKLMLANNSTKMVKAEVECDEISAITQNCGMPERTSVSGHDEHSETKIVSKLTMNQKEPVSSYENVAGVKKLFRSPKQQKEPVCSYEDFRGVKKLLKTPKQRREPVSSYEDVRGVKKLLTTPKQQREPLCSYEDVRGVKKLLTTPKQQREPLCSYEDVRGVKKLLTTPKQQREPFSSYEDVRGVKKLLTTPKQQKEPACSYEDVRGVKKLLKTPKQQREPACSYEDVRGVKKLLTTPKQQREPTCSYEDVRGVKKLLKTPKQQNEPASSYEDLTGVKDIFKTPIEQKESFNSYKNIEGMNSPLKIPKIQVEPQSSYENVDGVKELFKTPQLTYSRRIRKNTEGDNKQISEEHSKMDITGSSTPANSLYESEDAEKHVRSLRKTRRNIKTKQCESESNESISEGDENHRKQTRKLRKNVETTASKNMKDTFETTETSSKTEATETLTKNLHENVEPTIRTRRARAIKTEVANSTANEEIKRPNTRTRKGAKEEIVNERPKRTTRKQIKDDEIYDNKKAEEKQYKKRPSATVEKDNDEENTNFDVDNSEESHKNVITNLIRRNQSKRRKANLDEDRTYQLNDGISIPNNETPDSNKKRQPKRKKTETSDFGDINNESDVNSKNDDNIKSLQRKQPRRRKATEIELDTSESFKNKIDAADDKNETTARKMRSRRKNDDLSEEKPHVQQNDGVESGRSLRTRRQKKTDTIGTDNSEKHKENVDSPSAKKTKVVAFLEEEQQVRRSKRTPKTKNVAFENNKVDDSPVTVRETRKRTRKILSNDEIEAASDVMCETKKKTRRAKAAVNVEEEITPIRKSTRQRR